MKDLQTMNIPPFIYGTAWKEQETKRLTHMALNAGFRGIDTANQRRHYVEAGVGEALKQAFEENLVQREEVFIQTKFTYVNGQDHRLPYDPHAPFGTQVEQSFEKSREHLGVSYLDSYVLHGPSMRYGLSDTDWETWRAMEKLHKENKTRFLGISNVGIDQLEQLYDHANIKPTIVQNRCFASMGWDRDVRLFCHDNGIIYQGFSLLTANPEIMQHPHVQAIASRMEQTIAQVVFRFAMQAHMIPLTGTTSADHMAQDLSVCDFQLEAHDVEIIEMLMG